MDEVYACSIHEYSSVSGPCPMCEEASRLRSKLSAAEGRLREARDVLQRIADFEGEACPRCEGNGLLWADGKAHLPSHGGATINCGHCGGEGKIYEDVRELALARLAVEDAGDTFVDGDRIGSGNTPAPANQGGNKPEKENP